MSKNAKSANLNKVVALHNKELVISANTAELIRCKLMLQELWNKVQDAIEAVYSTEVAERVMNEQYTDHSFAIETIIDQYIALSITENLGDLPNISSERIAV